MSQFKKIICFFAIFFISSSISASGLLKTNILVGSYCTEKCEISWFASKNKPLLLTSSDNGASWSFISKIENAPENFDLGMTETVFCKENICLAGGTLIRSEKTLNPFLLRSTDFGKTWSFLKFSFDLNRVKLNAVYCSDQTCVAGGRNYSDTYDDASSILLFSKDKGVTWSRIEKIDGLSHHKYDGIAALKCIGKNCIAAGGSRYPNIILSRDQGESWTAVKDIYNLPSDSLIDSFYILSVDCLNNRNCVAIGYYSINAPTYPVFADFPVILSSQDAGASWSMIQNIKDMPKDGTTRIDEVTCTNNQCVAVGFHGANIFTRRPMVLVSNDNGRMWSFKKIEGVESGAVGELYSVSCMIGLGKSCAAVGELYYENEKRTVPIVVMSLDSELWFNQKNISNPSKRWASLSTVKCDGPFCKAAGAYIRDKKEFPLIMTTPDAGKSWVTTQNISGLPDDIKMIGSLDLR